MSPDDRTGRGESRDHLVAELKLIEDLLRRIESWYLAQSRIAFKRTSLLSKITK